MSADRLPDDEPESAARRAGLRYVSDDRPGIRRRGRGRGFSYYSAEGERITDPATRRRLDDLAIPPAWDDVWICPRADGHLQATGRDDKERKQYVYHPRWRDVRDATKFRRMEGFGAVLPVLRERVDADLRRHGLPREKVLAAAVALLDKTLIRIGNAEYTRENGSYGLTTLEQRHAEATTRSVRFSFRGKSGKDHEVDLQDRRLARLISLCQELPGQALFQYEHEDGETVCSVDSEDVNDYLHEATGSELTAKDFRTWGASVLATGTLHDAGPAESEKAAETTILAAYDTVAEALNNTRAVCRSSYVHPRVPVAYREGWLFDLRPRGARSLAASERRFLALLARAEPLAKAS